MIGSQLITEQAAVSLPRGAQIAGTCGSSEAELHVSWSNNAYTFRLYFIKVRKFDPSAECLAQGQELVTFIIIINTH